MSTLLAPARSAAANEPAAPGLGLDSDLDLDLDLDLEASLPPGVAQALWRGDALGRPVVDTVPSGWSLLDAELPGRGWPRRSIVEVLTAQPAVLEWRLLAPSLGSLTDAGGQVVVIGPPRHPHLPGLQHLGLAERQFVWIQADAPAERLWVTEQLIKSNAAGAILAWLPKARHEQLRRLQVCAQGCEGLVFLCRPEAARHEASAAPLRVQATPCEDWQLGVHILKRKGPPHEGPLMLPSVPGGLASVLTPRLRRPSRLVASSGVADVTADAAVDKSANDVVGRAADLSRLRRAAA